MANGAILTAEQERKLRQMNMLVKSKKKLMS